MPVRPGEGGRDRSRHPRARPGGRAAAGRGRPARSPTSTSDLAPALVRLAEAGQYGTYHCTNSGECSWHELAVHVLRRSGLAAPVARIDSATLARPARRPAYSVMSNLMFEHVTGDRMPHRQDAVDRYLGLGARALRASEEAR